LRSKATSTTNRVAASVFLAASVKNPEVAVPGADPARSLDQIHLHNRKFPDEVDILKLMNVSAKDQGVSLVEGPITNFPAYKFRLPYGNVPLPNSTVVTTAMNSPEGFTVVFLYRQQKNNLGTLISVNSPGRLTPWFQLNSNSKMGVLMLKYRMETSAKLRQMDWELPKHHRKSPLAGKSFVNAVAVRVGGRGRPYKSLLRHSGCREGI
jgi:hypothetical protein